MSDRYGLIINDWGMDQVDMETMSIALDNCEPMQRFISRILDDELHKILRPESKNNNKQH